MPGNFIGDLLFGGFIIVMAVILINDQANAVKLAQGGADVYTSSVKNLATIR